MGNPWEIPGKSGRFVAGKSSVPGEEYPLAQGGASFGVGLARLHPLGLSQSRRIKL